jgi:hypothetical protein
MDIFDLPRDQFNGLMSEMDGAGRDTSELRRQYGRANSIFGGIYDWADQTQQDLADEGRRSVGGFLSKQQGTTGMDALRSTRFEPSAFVSGLLGGVAEGFDAPAQAARGDIPSEDMVNRALGTAGSVTLGGAAMPRPLGSIGMGGRPAADRVNKDALDPFGYGSVRLDDYLDNTQLHLVDLGENLPRVSRSWEDLEGGYVLPLYGDRTSRGYNIEGVNDTQFSRPVYTEGGFDFMRGPANQQDGAVWASAKHIIDRINGAAQDAAALDGGRPVYGVTGSMAPNGVDFANMTGESMAELVMGNRGRIDPTAISAFDDIMLNRDAAYPGLLSNELRDWAGGTTSEARKSFIRGLDTAPMRRAGVLSPALARYSVTDPTLRDVPSGQFGSAAAQLRPDAPLLYNDAGHNSAPRAPHSTYNTQLLGDYFGQLPLVPQGLLFRDAYGRMAGQLDKNGNPLGEANRTYTIKTQLTPQLMTPEVVDGLMGYLTNGQGPQ